MSGFRTDYPPADVIEAARKVELYMRQNLIVGFAGLALRSHAEAGKQLADAVTDLVNCRGRYHTEQNYRTLKDELSRYNEVTR